MSNNGSYKESCGMDWNEYIGMQSGQKEGRGRAPQRGVFDMRIQPTSTGPMERTVQPRTKERYEEFECFPVQNIRGSRPKHSAKAPSSAFVARLDNANLDDSPSCSVPVCAVRPPWNNQTIICQRESNSRRSTSPRRSGSPTTGTQRDGDERRRDQFGNVNETYEQARRRKRAEDSRKAEKSSNHFDRSGMSGSELSRCVLKRLKAAEMEERRNMEREVEDIQNYRRDFILRALKDGSENAAAVGVDSLDDDDLWECCERREDTAADEMFLLEMEEPKRRETHGSDNYNNYS